jgi:hypothetical protein
MGRANQRMSVSLQTILRRAAFVVLMACIYFGPAPGQLFDAHSPWLREWVMFKGVGSGLPRGAFTVTQADGTVHTYTALEAAGLDRYPLIRHYQFEGRVFATDQLYRFARTLCAEIAATSTVSFDGKVGTVDGWKLAQSDDVCAPGAEQP